MEVKKDGVPIMDIQRVSAFVKTKLDQSRKTEQQEVQTPPREKGDQVEISSEARQAIQTQRFTAMLQTGEKMDPTSAERVQVAREKLQSGDYLSKHVAKQIAEKIAEELV